MIYDRDTGTVAGRNSKKIERYATTSLQFHLATEIGVWEKEENVGKIAADIYPRVVFIFISSERD